MMDISALLAAWRTWLAAVASLRGQHAEVASQFSALAELERRAALIASPETRAAVAARLARRRGELEVISRRLRDALERAAWVHSTLRAAVDALVPGTLTATDPSLPGVGVAPAVPVILAAAGIAASIVATIAVLSYQLAASRRNLDAERSALDLLASGRVTAAELPPILSALQPGGAGGWSFSAGSWAMLAAVGVGLYFLTRGAKR